MMVAGNSMHWPNDVLPNHSIQTDFPLIGLNAIAANRNRTQQDGWLRVGANGLIRSDMIVRYLRIDRNVNRIIDVAGTDTI